MELLRELYHVLLAVAFFVTSTLGAKDKELYCGGKFYMPTIINFRLQLTHLEINTLSTGPNFLWKSVHFLSKLSFGKIAQKWKGKDLNQEYLPFTWKN